MLREWFIQSLTPSWFSVAILNTYTQTIKITIELAWDALLKGGETQKRGEQSEKEKPRHTEIESAVLSHALNIILKVSLSLSLLSPITLYIQVSRRIEIFEIIFNLVSFSNLLFLKLIHTNHLWFNYGIF
jgi:hypothetical protein